MTPAAGDHKALRRTVPLLALVTAIVVAIEFVVVGLLPSMARDLGISLAAAGRLVSAFALSAALLGPLLTLAATRIQPRRSLAAVATIFGVGNLLAAAVPSHGLLLAVRIVEGAVLPVFVSVGAGAIAILASPERQGRAIAQVNIGTIAGLVFAVPVGVALGTSADWRTVFAGLGVLALAGAAALAIGLPTVSTSRRHVGQQAIILRSPIVLSHLVLSATVFAAMFVSYAYLAAILEIEAGYRGVQVAVLLMGFSAIGLIGNAIGGRVADRRPTEGTVAALLVVTLAVGAISVAGGQSWSFVPLLALWGVGHAAGFVLCQVRVMSAGDQAPAFAMSLNIAACNLGIAVGALAGGILIEASGLRMLGAGTAAFAALAVSSAVIIQRIDQRRSAASRVDRGGRIRLVTRSISDRE